MVAVKLPEVPVIVTGPEKYAALLLAVSVNTLLPLVGFVPHVAVTPLGNPDAANVTLPVNPYCGVTVIEVVIEELWLTDTPDGLAESAKLGPWTITACVVVSVMSPDVPVMVNVALAFGAELLAASVSTLVPVVGLVPHDAVTPVGNPAVTARWTPPLKPPASFTVMVAEPDAPGLTVTAPED